MKNLDGEVIFLLILLGLFIGLITTFVVNSIHDNPYNLACLAAEKGNTTMTWFWESPDTSYCVKTESKYTPYSEVNK